MELVMIIAGEEYSDRIGTLLIENGFQATEVGRNGEFLQYGDMVLLVGVKSGDSDKVVELLKQQKYIGRSEIQGVQNKASVYVMKTDRYQKIEID